MSPPIVDLLKRVWRPPINVDLEPADHDKHYKTWGLNLYRTFYNPEFDQQWKLLIDKISKTVLGRLSKYEYRGMILIIHRSSGNTLSWTLALTLLLSMASQETKLAKFTVM
jgi:hypothetical protein